MGYGAAQSTTISTPVNAATNQLSGYTYDANGNLISTGYAYDAENRISSVNAGAVEYFYDAQNKRIWEAACNPNACSGSNWLLQSQTINLFGADGKQLASYSLGTTVVNNQVSLTWGPIAIRSYFGGRLVAQQSGINNYQAVVQDRLGSVGKYYPYGEERNSPQLPNDQVKFATYTRDSATGNDYADQRYYTSTLGRFMTPDPYVANEGGSGDPRDPRSWNRYAYSGEDPTNYYDPEGQFWVPAPQPPPPQPAPLIPGLSGQYPISNAVPKDFTPSFTFSLHVQPNVPAQNNFSQNQMQALTAGLNNALDRLISGSGGCADALSGNDSYMAALDASFTLAATLYRILPLAADVGATTLDASDVVINATGAFFTAAPNANGTVTVLMPNAQGVQTQFTFASVSDLQGFLLLHELGHQLGTFGPDVNNAINSQNSETVLDNCFTETNGVWN